MMKNDKLLTITDMNKFQKCVAKYVCGMTDGELRIIKKKRSRLYFCEFLAQMLDIDNAEAAHLKFYHNMSEQQRTQAGEASTWSQEMFSRGITVARLTDNEWQRVVTVIKFTPQEWHNCKAFVRKQTEKAERKTKKR